MTQNILRVCAGMWLYVPALSKDPRIGQKAPIVLPRDVNVSTPVVTEKVPAKRLEIDLSQIPERSNVANNVPSQLSGLLATGLARLSDERYATDTTGTLNFMVKAMGASVAGASDADVSQAVAQVKGSFAKLLKGMVRISAETLTSIAADTPKLVELAVVALGNGGLTGKKDAGQLVADLDKVQAGLTELINMPSSERAEFIEKLSHDFKWAAGVFSRGSTALESAGFDPSARLQAIAGIFAIVSKYGAAES